MQRRVFLNLAAAPLAAASKDATPVPVVAQTLYGKVRGKDAGGIKVFKGIPYGANTAGGNRFRPPAKPPKWSGVRDAMDWGHIAPQTLVVNPGEYEQLIEWDKQRGGINEDCLNLNVWTPGLKDGRKRTVLVSFHGGGFTGGSANAPGYDGEPLARFGNVVVVAVNHRLGVLGYLHLGDLGGPEFAQSGVVGMMDCVASLAWVRENIENFGGDPANVMIFGQSGGGAKTSTLLSMPSAKGLFERAAVQSGSVLRLMSREAGTKLAEQLLTQLGIDKGRIGDLQNVPVEKIREAQAALARRTPPIAFGPVVDGSIIPRNPFDPAAPDVSADVPMIIGTTLDDAALRLRNFDLTEDGLRSMVKGIAGDKTEQVLKLYRSAYPNASPYLIQARILTDRGGRRNATIQAERKTAQGRAPAYLYRFDWPSPGYGGKFGAVHGMDVGLSFHNANQPLYQDLPEARVLADKFASAWIAFARTGNPDTKELPHWPAYNTEQRPTMIFDKECRVENDPNHEIRLLWQGMAS